MNIYDFHQVRKRHLLGLSYLHDTTLPGPTGEGETKAEAAQKDSPFSGPRSDGNVMTWLQGQ